MKLKLQISNLRSAVTAIALLCLSLSAHSATTNSVQTTNAPAASTANTNRISGTDFPSFKIISQRNIFSANRSGRVASSGPARKPTKVDTFTLVGTVDYSKGQYAIFDGSSSSFRKTVTMGDSLAGFEIKDVDLDHVTISATNGTETVLHVGSQMRRVDDGDWTLSSGSSPSVAKSSVPSDSGDDIAPAKGEINSDSSDEPAPSAADNDVLKKLMQKRKAEVKNESE
jgi:hypothetical protein